MTKSDEMTLKKWLFVQWQKTHNPKFFLAGAVIGNVADIYPLAAKYSISADEVQNFYWKTDICRAMDASHNIKWLIHVLNNWADDPANNVPQDIHDLLKRNHDSGNKSFPFSNGQAYRFSDEHLRMPTDEEKAEIRIKELDAVFAKRRKEMQKDLVSRTESARKYEDMLRTLHSSYYFFPRKPALATDNAKFVENEMENFFAEKIKRAKTNAEIIAVWLEMTDRMSDLDEIMECLDRKLLQNYSKFDADFLTFIEKWRSYREFEIVAIELKADFKSVNLHENFAESV